MIKIFKCKFCGSTQENLAQLRNHTVFDHNLEKENVPEVEIIKNVPKLSQKNSNDDLISTVVVGFVEKDDSIVTKDQKNVTKSSNMTNSTNVTISTNVTKSKDVTKVINVTDSQKIVPTEHSDRSKGNYVPEIIKIDLDGDDNDIEIIEANEKSNQPNQVTNTNLGDADNSDIQTDNEMIDANEKSVKSNQVSDVTNMNLNDDDNIQTQFEIINTKPKNVKLFNGFTNYVTQWSMVKRHKCNVCNKFIAHKEIENHIKSAHGAFKCERCDYFGLSTVQIENHKNFYAGKKPQKCYFCQFKSCSKSGLSKHIYQNHKNIAKNKMELKNHIKKFSENNTELFIVEKSSDEDEKTIEIIDKNPEMIIDIENSKIQKDLRQVTMKPFLFDIILILDAVKELKLQKNDNNNHDIYYNNKPLTLKEIAQWIHQKNSSLNLAFLQKELEKLELRGDLKLLQSLNLSSENKNAANMNTDNDALSQMEIMDENLENKLENFVTNVKIQDLTPPKPIMSVTISKHQKNMTNSNVPKGRGTENIILPSYAKKEISNVTNGVTQNYRTYFPHQSKKHYNCHKCSMVFPIKNGLKQFKHKCKKTRNFCNKCQLVFSNEMGLKRHYKKAHYTIYPSYPKKEILRHDNSAPFHHLKKPSLKDVANMNKTSNNLKLSTYILNSKGSENNLKTLQVRNMPLKI